MVDTIAIIPMIDTAFIDIPPQSTYLAAALAIHFNTGLVQIHAHSQISCPTPILAITSITNTPAGDI
jgi:hypothetical protein